MPSNPRKKNDFLIRILYPDELWIKSRGKNKTIRHTKNLKCMSFAAFLLLTYLMKDVCHQNWREKHDEDMGSRKHFVYKSEAKGIPGWDGGKSQDDSRWQTRRLVEQDRRSSREGSKYKETDVYLICLTIWRGASGFCQKIWGFLSQAHRKSGKQINKVIMNPKANWSHKKGHVISYFENIINREYCL